MERFLKQPIINKTENILNKYLVEFKNGFRFILAKDDLTIQDTHVIVNAANNDLWLGGGVAGAIRKKRWRGNKQRMPKLCEKIW
jgi:hypothetical protein